MRVRKFVTQAWKIVLRVLLPAIPFLVWIGLEETITKLWSWPFELMNDYPIAALVIFVFLLWGWNMTISWAKQKKQIRQLSSRLEPKLKLECHPNIDGCRMPTKLTIPQTLTLKDVVYLRILVTSDEVEIVNCAGYVTKIVKDNKTVMAGEKLDIPFAMALEEDAHSKTIRCKVPEYLDVIAIDEHNHIIFPPPMKKPIPASVKTRTLFSVKGTYSLTILVSGKDITTSEMIAQLKWTGDWSTAELSGEQRTG